MQLKLMLGTTQLSLELLVHFLLVYQSQLAEGEFETALPNVSPCPPRVPDAFTGQAAPPVSLWDMVHPQTAEGKCSRDP